MLWVIKKTFCILLQKKIPEKSGTWYTTAISLLPLTTTCPAWEDLAKLKYIKGTGTATVIEDLEEMQKALGLLIRKFPFLAKLPGDPSDFVGIRVELKNVLITDNTIHFGNTEKVNY